MGVTVEATILETLLASGPLAGVLAYALRVVWGRYQAALHKIDDVREAHREEIKALRSDHEAYVRQLADEALGRSTEDA